MSVTFTDDWGAEIAEISNQPAYQNCQIEILDPTAQTFTVNVETGTSTLTGTSLIWSGIGRVAMLRSTVDTGSGSATDPSGLKKVLVQFPHDGYQGRVKRGWFIRVTNGGRDPGLTGYNFVVDADVTGSHAASFTVQCTINVETIPAWA